MHPVDGEGLRKQQPFQASGLRPQKPVHRVGEPEIRIKQAHRLEGLPTGEQGDGGKPWHGLSGPRQVLQSLGLPSCLRLPEQAGMAHAEVQSRILLKTQQLELQLVGLPKIVRVEKGKEGPPGFLHTAVTGRRRTEPVLPDNPHPAAGGSGDGQGVVFGAIIHNHHLQIPVGLIKDAGQGLGEIAGSVEGGNDATDQLAVRLHTA